MFELTSLKIPLVGVTESAARACAPFIGSGKKDEGDGMAVDAMRSALNQIEMAGTIVIGEGAKDDAPMLFDGEIVGTGQGPKIDIAVDPIEGTNLFATDAPGSICTLAAAPAGTMYRPGVCFYMDKQVYPRSARGRIDPQAPVRDRLAALADAVNKDIGDIKVFVLSKPRHERLVSEIYGVGAKVRLVSDGDVNGAVMAILNQGVDALFGIGGTPEGIVSACAARAMGAEMFGRMAPQKTEEVQACRTEGVDTENWLDRDTLIGSDDILFLASGLTRGDYVDGVVMGRDATGHFIATDTIVIAGANGNVRRIRTSVHQ